MRQVVCPGFATSPVLKTFTWEVLALLSVGIGEGNKGIGEKPSAASAAARDAEVFSIEAMVQSQSLFEKQIFQSRLQLSSWLW